MNWINCNWWNFNNIKKSHLKNETPPNKDSQFRTVQNHQRYWISFGVHFAQFRTISWMNINYFEDLWSARDPPCTHLPVFAYRHCLSCIAVAFGVVIALSYVNMYCVMAHGWWSQVMMSDGMSNLQTRIAHLKGRPFCRSECWARHVQILIEKPIEILIPVPVPVTVTEHVPQHVPKHVARDRAELISCTECF